MSQTLDVILENLQTDENKLNFLGGIYTPGNTEVADAILALNPDDLKVLKGELKHSKAEGLEDRFRFFARKFIDLYVAEDWDITLKNEVISWDDKGIADYAISRFTEKGKEDSLEYTAEIATQFGRESEGRQLMERVFDLKMAKSGKEYPFLPAETAVKLERFDQAINLYVKAGYGWLDIALKIAQEHVPERVTEIATLGFNRYDSDRNHLPELYLESARILGKEGKAERVLKKEAKRLKVDREPRCYEELVNALISLELNDQARSVADRVEAYEIGQMRTQRWYNGDNQRELARIFLALGDKEKAAEAYLRKIDKESPEHNPSHFMPDIDKVYELTGDSSVFDVKIFVFEIEEQYDKAEGLAR